MPKKKKKKRVNPLKFLMVDWNLSQFWRSGDLEAEGKEQEGKRIKRMTRKENPNKSVNGGVDEKKVDDCDSEEDGEEEEEAGDLSSDLESDAHSFTSKGVLEECACIDARDLIEKRNSDLFILNTISSSKSKKGNLLGKTAWETINKSGTRWVIRSFIKFGRSSFISKSILDTLGTYLFDSIWWFETDLPLVALTIDDVPGLDPETNQRILDLLNEYGIKCTFFVTERNARYIKDADIFLRRCINEGHELGNHLAKDVPAHKLSISTFTKHLLECEHLITKYNPDHIFTNTCMFPPMFTSWNDSTTASLSGSDNKNGVPETSSTLPSFCVGSESIGINWKFKSFESEKQEKSEEDENSKFVGQPASNYESTHRRDANALNSNIGINDSSGSYQDYESDRNQISGRDKSTNGYSERTDGECTRTLESFICRGESKNNVYEDEERSEDGRTHETWPNPRFKWFRPPFGRLTKQQYDLVISRGYTVVMCDVYPNDVSFQGFPQFLAQLCTNNAAPGSIVCLHIPSNSFRSANVEVLRLMLPEISRKYKCVTLSELATQIYRCKYAVQSEHQHANTVTQSPANASGKVSSGNSFITIKSSETSPRTVHSKNE